MQENSGLIFSSDPRDKEFAFGAVAKERPPIQVKEWWDDGWWGDQRSTPHCVAYSWMHFMEDGPVIQDIVTDRPKPFIKPERFYAECKKIDGLEGNDSGTTIRAGAKIAKKLQFISEYRWGNNINDVIDALLIFGPVIVGTHWYAGMNTNGLMRTTGRKTGGHAYVLNGVDLNKETLRVKNSWGKNWGNNGHGTISLKSFEQLINEGGEICIPFELKLNNIPKL